MKSFVILFLLSFLDYDKVGFRTHDYVFEDKVKDAKFSGFVPLYG